MQKISKKEELELRKISRSQKILYLFFPRYRHLQRLIIRISDLFYADELAVLDTIIPFSEQLLIRCCTRHRTPYLTCQQIITKSVEIIKKNRYLFKRNLTCKEIREVFLTELTNLVTIEHKVYKSIKNPHVSFWKPIKRIKQASLTISEIIESSYPGLFTVKTMKGSIPLHEHLYQKYTRNPYALINSKYIDFEKETKKLLEQYKWYFKKASMREVDSHIYKEEILSLIHDLFTKSNKEIKNERFLYELPISFFFVAIYIIIRIITK